MESSLGVPGSLAPGLDHIPISARSRWSGDIGLELGTPHHPGRVDGQRAGGQTGDGCLPEMDTMSTHSLGIRDTSGVDEHGTACLP